MAEEKNALMRLDTETGEVAVIDEPAERRLITDPYRGISERRFNAAQEAILTESIPVDDLDILPTGEVYASQVRYRRILNQAFGPGGWALKPRGPLVVKDDILYREYALFAEGRFIAEAVGEQEYLPSNSRMTYATAAESVKSNALMRCCKDLCIASECWDRRFTEEFKEKYCEKYFDKRKNKYLWRRKGSAVPVEEVRPTPTDKPSKPSTAAPTPEALATPEQRAALWRTIRRQLGEEGAAAWLTREMTRLKVHSKEELRVKHISELILRATQQPEQEPPPLSEEEQATIVENFEAVLQPEQPREPGEE